MAETTGGSVRNRHEAELAEVNARILICPPQAGQRRGRASKIRSKRTAQRMREAGVGKGEGGRTGQGMEAWIQYLKSLVK